MFDVFRSGAEWWLVGLLIVLLLGPVVFYLIGPWKYRREEILGNLSSSSKRLYFETFFVGLEHKPPKFEDYYDRRFGRIQYVLPVLFLLMVGGTAALWTVRSILVWTKLRPETLGILDATSVAALSGGYVWVVADLVSRWRFRDLLPSDLWWSAWRIVIAAPLALAIGKTFATELAVPIAFLLGSFPTKSISTLARRFARRTLNLGADADQETESQLQKIQGIDTRIAERFAEEGVTTIVQLAYADPVELTIRCASFSFSFVVDAASQALAWLYLEDSLAKLRGYSLRGAQEIASLVSELDGDDASLKQIARTTIDEAAVTLNAKATSFERALREIADDPYTQFLSAVWASE